MAAAGRSTKRMAILSFIDLKPTLSTADEAGWCPMPGASRCSYSTVAKSAALYHSSTAVRLEVALEMTSGVR